MKRNNFLTGKDYTEELVTSIRIEQRRSNDMTTATIEPFCRKYNVNIGCFDGFRVCPRNFTEKKIALQKQNNSFCWIGNSNIISLIK